MENQVVLRLIHSGALMELDKKTKTKQKTQQFENWKLMWIMELDENVDN